MNDKNCLIFFNLCVADEKKMEALLGHNETAVQSECWSFGRLRVSSFVFSFLQKENERNRKMN